MPHFDAAPSTNATTDQWLLLMHPQLQAVPQELYTLSQELSRAADSADSAPVGHSDKEFSIILPG